MKRILIANRGEIACRIIRSAHGLGLETVAVHSEPDAAALHVALAGAAELIGPGPAKSSYLLAERILEAALKHGADAVHPGYGFLAENYRFAEAVQAAGLKWIGPRPSSIEDMGDKERARDIAKAAGVPVLPGSARFAPDDLTGLEEAAEEVGFPLLVKAAAGGGGIGMRRVDDIAKLREVVEATQAMAAKAFGDGTIYLERLVLRARHVEIQVFGYGDGHALHLYERECSIQRRFQKIIEESPAPNLPASVREGMAAAAVALVHHERYSGAGTVEFVVDADTNAYYFLEMNTRIQVEHPVTEMTTGFDLVAMQIELARGTLAQIVQAEVGHQGHAVEARLYAENPAMNFLPSPGPLNKFEVPRGREGVRVDTGVRTGDTITFHYDPMIAKIIAHGASRDEAITRLRDVLIDTVVEGVKTNRDFLIRTLDHPAFRAGETHTGFVEQHKAALLAV